MDINRAYKVLGLYPGASKDDVKRAYRDLAQVWHPDRFEHNERLAEKAQKNLKRINEAFALLKDYDPPPDARPPSRLGQTFSAVKDLGDMLTTRIPGVRRPRRGRRPVVLGLGEIERTGVSYRRKRKSKAWIFWFLVAVVTVAVILWLAWLR
ncbi:MAG: J domain-containing protein [Gemmatimonadota bacterium]|nr:MAG: J domain-containing protein [Gemmatimonadota bacterium]